jgi:hypothetical protein
MRREIRTLKFEMSRGGLEIGRRGKQEIGKID